MSNNGIQGIRRIGFTVQRILEKALKIYRSRLWEELTLRNIFAVELSDGTLGYILMQNDIDPLDPDPGPPKTCRLMLFTGEGGIRSIAGTMVLYDSVWDTEQVSFEDRFARRADYVIRAAENLSLQDCIMADFVFRRDMTPEKRDEVKKAAYSAHISLSGFRTLPVIRRFSRGLVREEGLSEEDITHISEALDAVLFVTASVSRADFGYEIFHLLDGEGRIPLIRKDMVLSVTDYPHASPLIYRGVFSSAAAGRIARKPRGEEWMCLTCRIPAIVSADEGDLTYPLLLCVYSRESENLVCRLLLESLNEERTEVCLNKFVDVLEYLPEKPMVMHARDTHTRQILSGLCKECGIGLTEGRTLDKADRGLSEQMEEDFGDELNIPGWF